MMFYWKFVLINEIKRAEKLWKYQRIKCTYIKIEKSVSLFSANRRIKNIWTLHSTVVFSVTKLFKETPPRNKIFYFTEKCSSGWNTTSASPLLHLPHLFPSSLSSSYMWFGADISDEVSPFTLLSDIWMKMMFKLLPVAQVFIYNLLLICLSFPHKKEFQMSQFTALCPG